MSVQFKSTKRLSGLSCGLSCRIARGQGQARDAAIYVNRSKRSITLTAAATAWSQGVPWAEALSIATRAIANASPKARALRKGKGKGKGKAKG